MQLASLTNLNPVCKALKQGLRKKEELGGFSNAVITCPLEEKDDNRVMEVTALLHWVHC